MTSTTSEAVIRALHRIFATHGYPDVIVSDNGPQLTSHEFSEFITEIGAKHSLISPFFPQSNGRAERAVRSAKEALGRWSSGSWQAKIDQYLFAQHTTPAGDTGKSPAELLMGRKLRTKMDRLHPRFQPARDKTVDPGFQIKTPIYARNYSCIGPKWVPGTIVQIAGPKTYVVELEGGSTCRKHRDQIRKRSPLNQEHQTNVNKPFPTFPVDSGGLEGRSSPLEASPARPAGNNSPLIQVGPGSHDEATPREAEAKNTTSPNHALTPTEPRRSSRQTQRPAYLKDYVC